jgi:putative hydrolase of the HAD superfamily
MMAFKVRLRPRAVLFDAEGTLFGVRGSVGEIYARIAEKHGVVSDPETLGDRFRRSIRTQKPFASTAPSLEERQSREKDWWRRVVASVFEGIGTFADFDFFFEEVFDLFRGAKGWLPYPETLGALRSLRALGFSMGVVSNFDFRLEGVLRSLEMDRFFDALVTPGLAGVSKPDPGIFQTALDCLQVAASQAVHVGDSLLSDVQGARGAGIAPIFLDRSGQASAGEGLVVIQSLAELADVLILE